LLSELHVALLKLIIKDIEDVARTPSIGLGINQYYTANPEGGHPQIVQGVSSAPWTCLLVFIGMISFQLMLNRFLLLLQCIRHIHGVLIYATGSNT
jgi:hypothetical protein